MLCSHHRLKAISDRKERAAAYRREAAALPPEAPEEDEEPGRVEGLRAALRYQEEARRRAKQDYYNAQIALGNMRVQLPKPGEEA